MPHPYFDTGSFPWSRPEAKALIVQLNTVIPNVPEIVAIYERSGGDRASLNSHGSPAEVWHSALTLLAAGGRLGSFLDELASIGRLQHNADFQAAIRAVREAKPIPTRQAPDPGRPSRWPIAVGGVIGVIALTVFFFVGSAMAQSLFSIDVPWIPGTGQAPNGSPESTTVDAIPRLQGGPVAVDSEGVVTTIERVDQRGNLTEIELTVQNNLSDTIVMPTSAAALVGADGTTVAADPFAGDWNESLPAGLLGRGTIVLNGVLPPGATSATFSFSTVIVQGFDGPESIIVPDLAIAAAPG